MPLGATPLVWPIALPYLLLCLGERLPFSRLEKVGDISYGIYIYSFLIQQCLYAAGCHRLGFWTFSGVSLGLSIIAGALSWLLVEQPFIRLGQRLTARWKIGAALKPLPINSASDQMLSAASHRAG